MVAPWPDAVKIPQFDTVGKNGPRLRQTARSAADSPWDREANPGSPQRRPERAQDCGEVRRRPRDSATDQRPFRRGRRRI